MSQKQQAMPAAREAQRVMAITPVVLGEGRVGRASSKGRKKKTLP